MRGRPRKFDEREVVDRAMQLFWLKGYEATGTAELLKSMGISRQSLYATFGSKRDLFIRVIEHYRQTQLSEAMALLDRDGPRLEGVRQLVRFFERLALDAQCRGCLVANTLVELAPHDEAIAAMLRDILEVLRAAIEKALWCAREEGELRPGKDPVELARALTNAVIGLAVTGRLRPDPDHVRAVHAGTLAMLD